MNKKVHAIALTLLIIAFLALLVIVINRNIHKARECSRHGGHIESYLCISPDGRVIRL